MTTRYHSDVSAGASATAATVNSPLGQLDAAINPTLAEYSNTGGTATTVTTAGTFYAVTAFEVSFTPAFTGQVVEILWNLYFLAGTAGTTTVLLRIVDGANATVTDNFMVGRITGGVNEYGSGGGGRCFTAAAGDVGVTRKAKVYVTHTVNGTSVTTASVSLTALYR